MAKHRAIVLTTLFLAAVLGGGVVGMVMQGGDEPQTQRAVSASGMGSTLDRGVRVGEGFADPGGLAASPLGGGGATAPAPPDPVMPGPEPDPAPVPPPSVPAPAAPPSIPVVNVKVIQALFAPSITASVTPSSGDVWHGGAKGICLDPGSGATYLTVDAHVHVGYGRSIASVSVQYSPNSVSDLTSWVTPDGALSYTVAFNSMLPGPYTMILTLKDNTGATAQSTKPYVVHDCVNPA